MDPDEGDMAYTIHTTSAQLAGGKRMMDASSREMSGEAGGTEGGTGTGRATGTGEVRGAECDVRPEPGQSRARKLLAVIHQTCHVQRTATQRSSRPWPP